MAIEKLIELLNEAEEAYPGGDAYAEGSGVIYIKNADNDHVGYIDTGDGVPRLVGM